MSLKLKLRNVRDIDPHAAECHIEELRGYMCRFLDEVNEEYNS